MTTKQQSNEEPTLFPQTLDEFYQSGVPDALIGFVPVKVITSIWEGEEATLAHIHYLDGKRKKDIKPTRVIEGSTWLSPKDLKSSYTYKIDSTTKTELEKTNSKGLQHLYYIVKCYLLEPEKIGVRNLPIEEMTDEELKIVKEFYIKRSLTRLLPEPEKTTPTSNISLTLVNWLSRRKDTEITIQGKTFVPEGGGLTDEKGKSINLTKKQTKLLAALASYLSPYTQDEYFKKIIQEYKGGDLPHRYAIKLYLADFVKEYVSSEGKARTEEIKKTLSELYTLSKISTTAIYGDKDNKKTHLTGKKNLFKIDEELTFDFVDDKTEANNPDYKIQKERERDNLRKLEYITIVFNPIFWYDLTTRYAILKKKIFQIWGAKGSGTDTELFSVILFRLLGVYTYKTLDYFNAWKTIDTKKYQGAIFKKMKIEAQIKALKYEISIDEVKSAIPTKDYDSNRKKRSILWKDLDEACKVYKNEEYCGIITGYETDKKKGAISFFLNPEYYPAKTKTLGK